MENYLFLFSARAVFFRMVFNMLSRLLWLAAGEWLVGRGLVRFFGLAGGEGDPRGSRATTTRANAAQCGQRLDLVPSLLRRRVHPAEVLHAIQHEERPHRRDLHAYR